MPLEYASMMREMCVAYRLLEDHGNLKPGDRQASSYNPLMSCTQIKPVFSQALDVHP